MPAEALEQIRHGFQRLQQMKRPDTASGALRAAIFRIAAEHEDRPVEALHQTRSHDAQHAAMPIVRREDQRALRIVDRHARALLHDLLRDFRFRQLALAVQRVQLLRQHARALHIAGEEHFDHRVGRIHASRGVDARRDAETPRWWKTAPGRW